MTTYGGPDLRNRKLLLFVGMLTLLSCLVLFPAAGTAQAYAGGGGCCEVCCPPPPITQELCVVDPCTDCKYQVCVTLPACCADEAPCMVSWRWGLFGRKVLTYKWASCDYCVDVVITKWGHTIVRD